jgi:hypothetical protein
MERSSRGDRDYGTVGKSNLVHDMFGVVPGKQTLTMGLDAQMSAPASAPVRAPSSPVSTGLADGINLGSGSGSLVDKTTSETSGGAASTASTTAAVASAAAAGADKTPPHLHDQIGGSGGTGSGDAGAAGGSGGTGSGDAGAAGGSVAAAGGSGATPAAAATATFNVINYPTTPAGVGRRIPPSKDVAVQVTIAGLAPSTNAVISLAGAGAGGNATLDGAATKTMNASGAVSLRGTAQTAPGSAGTLSLVAKVGTDEIGRSNAFTICAIPTTVSVAFGGLITGSERGIKMTTSNDSDSGAVADLDQVQMSEMVKYQNGTGCFAGINSGSNSGYLTANTTPHGEDSHGTPVSLLTGVGFIESVQGFKFKDARSGAADIGVAHSGFMITRTAEVVGAKTFLTTSKAGAATTVSGISVAAGSGSASKRQEV